MPAMSRPQVRKGDARVTAAVLSLALMLRLFVAAAVMARYPAGWLFTRGSEMGLLAQSLMDGRGLSSPFGGSTGPTAFIAPGYPIVVAAVFRLFGVETAASAVVIMLLQIALSVMTVWLILRIARALFSTETALVAGLVWACSPPLLWIPTIFWETSFSICLLTGLVALALHLRERVTAGRWVGLGAYVGVAALINPALLPAMTAVLLWLAWQTRARVVTVRAMICAGLMFVLVFSPWPIRNARVFHAFIPLRTTVGFELWMGNRAGASGFLEENLFPTYNPQELAAYVAKGEVGYTREKSSEARQYIAAHPGEFAALSLRRMGRFWLGMGTRPGSALFALHAALTSVLGLAGLSLLWLRKRGVVALLFAGPLLLFPLPYYITHAEFRYRLVVDPLLSVLAGWAAVSLFGHTRAAPPDLSAE